MIPPVVVDTNVLVAGVTIAHEAAPTAVIVDAMVAGRLPVLLSLNVLTEYRSVLLRPAIVSRHGLSESQVDTLLAAIVTHAMIEPAEVCPIDPPDPDDAHVRALLCARHDAVLVTGDIELVEGSRAVAEFRDRVLQPAEFMKLWRDPLTQ